MNYLTFPKVQKSIVIWGKGFNISLLKHTKWLLNKDLFYFGDLDSHGFKIMAICKKFFPNTKSIFMNEKTFNNFCEFKIKGQVLGKEETKNIKEFLNIEEIKLFNYLNENNIRLEQENISHDYILKNLYI